VRYFITGGAGFIGANYVEYLFENITEITSVTIYDNFTYAGNPKNYQKYASDPRLIVIKGDICDFGKLQRAMAGHDYVIHFAAESHVDRSIANGSIFVKTNVIGTYNLLEAARLNSIITVIHVSTDEVYGSLLEGFASETSILQPNSPYAASKAASDLLARSYCVTYGLDIRITRCCNNYGKYQFPEKVMPVFINKLASNQKVPIYGDGSNVREWIHVSDHCRGIQLVLEKGQSGEIYNIGSGFYLNNNNLALEIAGKMGLNQNYTEYVSDRPGHDFRYAIDSTKIKTLGFREYMNFEIGLKETIDWYLNNPKWWNHDS
jgi:dTDP-glucose 4,6-dehydratase